MSYFSVLVIGPNIEEQLAPYHEFECTGKNDQYIKDTDITNDVRKAYDGSTRTRFKDPAGEHHCPYQARFAVKGEGVFAPTSYPCPEGWEKTEIPTKELQSFLEYIEDSESKKPVPFGTSPDLGGDHKYGYVLLNDKGEVEKVINRTNPNAKWDYWREGGRWAGHFLLKAPAEIRPNYSWEWTFNADTEPLDPRMGDNRRADKALKGEVDWEAMMAEAGYKAAKNYDLAMSIFDHLPECKSWEEIRSEHEGDIEAARSAYHDQPRCKALDDERKKDFRNFPLGWDASPDDFALSRERYIENARNRSITTFAIVKDGQWQEKGQMGWFGISTNEKDQETWNSMFAKIIMELPEDTLLTVVDCHI